MYSHIAIELKTVRIPKDLREDLQVELRLLLGRYRRMRKDQEGGTITI
jgi:hypothetical protein